MPVCAVNDLQMYFEHHASVSSHDVPVLLLSGMASDSASWQPVVSALNEHFELIIPDNRCAGRTLPMPVSTSRSLMVDDLIGLLDALEVPCVNVVGHSMGGMLGWALAAKVPHRVQHLISMSAQATTIPARVALFKTMSSLRTDQCEAQWFELLFQFLFSPPFFDNAETLANAVKTSMAYEHKQSAAAFKAQAQALSTFLDPIDLSRVTCKVSMLTGSNDLLMTPDLMRAFCNQHGFAYTVIDDGAHALHWEKTREVAEFIVGQFQAV